MMLAIIKEDADGNLWFNESFLKEQKEREYRRGFMDGIKIEFHSIVPIDEEKN